MKITITKKEKVFSIIFSVFMTAILVAAINSNPLFSGRSETSTEDTLSASVEEISSETIISPKWKPEGEENGEKIFVYLNSEGCSEYAVEGMTGKKEVYLMNCDASPKAIKIPDSFREEGI